MKMPWKALAPVDDVREYVALLSYLPLKRYRNIPLFFRLTFQIQRQLAESRGAIGYALRAKLMSREFWTLSVWEDAPSVMDFVKKVPHGQAMKELSPHMGPTKFTRWKILGSALPPKWEEADQRSQES
jgi:hypothetical protein